MGLKSPVFILSFSPHRPQFSCLGFVSTVMEGVLALLVYSEYLSGNFLTEWNVRAFVSFLLLAHFLYSKIRFEETRLDIVSLRERKNCRSVCI